MHDDKSPPAPSILTAVEAMRRRPLMYFGPDPINQMVFEVIDMAVEAALRGECKHITITLKPNNVVTVENDGEGIPVEIDQHTQLSILEIIFTKSYVPGYSYPNSHYYVSGGYHGMDVMAVNAASEWLLVETKRDGFCWSQSYERGLTRTPLTRGRSLHPGERTGTIVSFKPDFTIFSQPVSLDKAVITQRCREIPYVMPGIKVVLRDEQSGDLLEQVFHAPQGLRSLIFSANSSNAAPVHDVIHASIRKLIRKPNWDAPHYDVEFAILFTESEMSIEFGYCNTIQTIHGGYHMKGLRDGLVQALNQHCPPHTSMFRWKHLAGIISSISIYHPNPQYESITRLNLLNAELHRPIKSAVAKIVNQFAATHPDQMQRIIDHCIANRRT